MSNKIELPENISLAKKVIDTEAEHKKLKARAGWLGIFFGNSPNTNLHIVGLIVILLLVVTIIYTIVAYDNDKATMSVERLWTIVLPVVTTMVGYIFGQNSKKED